MSARIFPRSWKAIENPTASGCQCFYSSCVLRDVVVVVVDVDVDDVFRLYFECLSAFVSPLVFGLACILQECSLGTVH